MFNNRRLLIATMHLKETVISPVFEKELGVICVTNDKLNTDQLGTFSGEIERKDDPLTTARNKCLLGLKLSDGDLAIASEGSFGPHPTLFFAHANEELLLFVDLKNNIEICVKELSLDTNFNGAEVYNETVLKEFATKVKFPSHGLILKQSKNSNVKIVKGITNWETLVKEFYNLKQYNHSVYVETDMRAMYNPTRMKVIESATFKLVKKINTRCPNCNLPGFGITDAKLGLPCELCGFKTQSILSYIHTCNKCQFTKEEKFPKGKFTEDPRFCDFCNP